LRFLTLLEFVFKAFGGHDSPGSAEMHLARFLSSKGVFANGS